MIKPDTAALMSELQRGLTCGRLTVKLATTESEKKALYRLRYEIFNEELGEGIPENAATGLDHDPYDPHCDHLMLLHNGAAVGTYRLLYGPERPAQGFYSQTEFDLSQLPFDWNHMVELGRGCIRKDFRKQTTLLSLFWGLHRYMMARGARYLMGLGSLAVMPHNDAEATFLRLIQEGRIDPTLHVTTQAATTFKGDASRGTAKIPPLISLYFEFGAHVLGRPAYDPIFRCHDILLYFDMDHLSKWGSELLERFDKRLITSSSTGSSVD